MRTFNIFTICKKTQIILLSFSISICLFGCQKERLPVPEYPLDAEAISKVLEECDMPYTVVGNGPSTGTDWQGETFAVYEEPDDTFAYAGISNAVKDGERTLGCIFINLNIDSDITEEECKQAIVFATRLFGHFKSETQVYDTFMKKFNPEDGLTWETEIDGIYCRIKFDKANEGSNYFLNVRFATDKDILSLEKNK